LMKFLFKEKVWGNISTLLKPLVLHI